MLRRLYDWTIALAARPQGLPIRTVIEERPGLVFTAGMAAVVGGFLAVRGLG